MGSFEAFCLCFLIPPVPRCAVTHPPEQWEQHLSLLLLVPLGRSVTQRVWIAEGGEISSDTMSHPSSVVTLVWGARMEHEWSLLYSGALKKDHRSYVEFITQRSLLPPPQLSRKTRGVGAGDTTETSCFIIKENENP